MAWLTELPAAALFAAACNLDTVLLAAGFSARGGGLGRGYGLGLAALTTLITWLSLALGSAGARLLGCGLARALGGLVLAGIGAWFVLDWLRRPGGGPPPAEPGPGGARAWVALAAALAVNNAGAGVAAGASGVAPGLAAAANFLATLAAPPLGRLLGGRLAGRLLGKYALPLAGVLLAALGLWEALPELA